MSRMYTPNYTYEELDKLTKAELLLIANDMGVATNTRMLKGDIINAILNK